MHNSGYRKAHGFGDSNTTRQGWNGTTRVFRSAVGRFVASEMNDEILSGEALTGQFFGHVKISHGTHH
jgi:hypothetical protein